MILKSLPKLEPRKTGIAILAGLLCFFLAGFGISVYLYGLKIHLVWAVIFPIVVALAYDFRYGIITGLSGGALFPFLLWSDNGYANLANILVLLFLYVLVGYINLDNDAKHRKFIISLLFVLAPFSVVIFIVYLFLFPVLFALNPPFWQPNAYSSVENQVLVIFVVKDLITYGFVIIFAELLLKLPSVRSFFKLPNKSSSRLNERLFLITLISGILLLSVYIFLDKIFLKNNSPLLTNHYTLLFGLFVWTGALVARNLITLLERRLESEDQLLYTQKRQDELIENIADVIAIIDANGYNRYKSPNVKKWFGWEPEELVGRLTWENIHPQDVDDVKKHFADVVSNGMDTKIIELRYRAKSGEYKWIEAYLSNCLHLKEIQGVIVNYHDISERRKAQLLQQQVVLTKKEAEFKQKFLANMSHEIRTPLTGIMGITDLLGTTEMDSVQKDYLQTLRQSSQNLKEIINLILDYSKIEAGKVKLKNVNFLTDSLLVDAENYFRSICTKPILIKISKGNSVPRFVNADKYRINQVIRNFISNSVKFSESGIISFSIDKVDAADTDLLQGDVNQYLKFNISDQGKGIPLHVQGKLFQPFFQVENENSRDMDGTGLGLAICKELVNFMGGKIGFRSEPGKGSQFWFTVKYDNGQKEENLEEEHDEPWGAHKSLNILLVEDKVINQKVISLLLKANGHKFVIAENGKVALEKFVPGQFDLILMDIQMPVMDGISATQLLRQMHSQLPPIVGLSANAFEGDREKYMNQGLDEYLTKPVNVKELNSVIDKLKIG
jgi:PAS domain S-box-containing protein